MSVGNMSALRITRPRDSESPRAAAAKHRARRITSVQAAHQLQESTSSQPTSHTRYGTPARWALATAIALMASCVSYTPWASFVRRNEPRLTRRHGPGHLRHRHQHRRCFKWAQAAAVAALLPQGCTEDPLHAPPTPSRPCYRPTDPPGGPGLSGAQPAPAPAPQPAFPRQAGHRAAGAGSHLRARPASVPCASTCGERVSSVTLHSL
ncbi:hypothetical protein V8C86DRAFT_1689967 [Haematococcus lacustris]